VDDSSFERGIASEGNAEMDIRKINNGTLMERGYLLPSFRSGTSCNVLIVMVNRAGLEPATR
jgi:hypothetical protein